MESLEYTAQAESSLVNGEVKLTISENSFSAVALFDAAQIPYAEINALDLSDYRVTVKADSGAYVFSRMGQWAQPFFDSLLEAYNKAVLRSLFIKGDPILFAKGDYRYTENGAMSCGTATVHVYENNVTVLPPDLTARRVPLCFVTGINKGDFELTLSLDTGESYTYAKLGYDTAPFADAVEKQIRALREKSLTTIKELDPSLTVAQASQLAKIMPEGAAAPMGQLMAIAPSFVAMLEEKLANTRAAEYYAALKELCDLSQIYIGVVKNETGEDSGGLGDLTDGGNPMEALGGLADGGNPMEALGNLTGSSDAPADDEDSETPPSDPYLLWLIAPSPCGNYAIVEFSEADTATFVYKTGGDFDGFARGLSRALEAISFKREVIRLTDEELRKPENADYYMAAKRTASLQFVRSNFASRIIHTNLEAWVAKLRSL